MEAIQWTLLILAVTFLVWYINRVRKETNLGFKEIKELAVYKIKLNAIELLVIILIVWLISRCP